MLVAEADGAARALWVTSWPKYAQHAWVGAWINCLFRNERPEWRSSELIAQAVAATRAVLGEPPPEGMVTFIDRGKVRRKRDFGRCYLRAGFDVAGETKGGLLVLRLPPERMPPPADPLRWEGA